MHQPLTKLDCGLQFADCLVHVPLDQLADSEPGLNGRNIGRDFGGAFQVLKSRGGIAVRQIGTPQQ